MADALRKEVLADRIWPTEGQSLRVKQILLVVAGIAALTLAAKIKIPIWPSPVPITLTTFAVLTIGVAYGPKLGLAAIAGYLLLGAFGWHVFAGSSAEANGLAYMMGGTGGYLLGYLLAALLLGFWARRGFDRSVGGIAAGMLIGTLLIYIPGLLWLGHLYGWDQPIIAWGLTPFLIGDALKLALAALLVPALWRWIGEARA